jgi:hypothetical protein
VDTQQILEQLKAERDRIEEAIRALGSLGGKTVSRRRGPTTRRHMSAEARARIGAAMKKRWAERKRKSKAA